MATNIHVPRGAFGLCILALLPIAFWLLYFLQTKQLLGSVSTSYAATPADGIPENGGLQLAPIIAESQGSPRSPELEPDVPKPDEVRLPPPTNAVPQHDDLNDDDMEILRPQWMSPEATPLDDLPDKFLHGSDERAFLVRPDFVQVVNHEGRLLSEGGWANDLPEGFWTKYHDNGLVASEGHYSDGVMSGLWIVYNEKNGAISGEMNVHNGKLHGICKFYDGQRDSGLYEHGKLVEKY